MSDTITIRDVPNDAHDEFTTRADLHGQSLQQYLRAYLTTLASKPDMKTLMAHIEERLERTGTNIPVERILEHLDASRR